MSNHPKPHPWREIIATPKRAAAIYRSMRDRGKLIHELDCPYWNHDPRGHGTTAQRAAGDAACTCEVGSLGMYLDDAAKDEVVK